MMKKTLLTFVFALAVFALQAAKHTVTVTNYSFSPSTLNVKEGDTVTWDFTQGSHTSTSGSSCTGDGKWDSGTKNAGDQFTFVFATKGTYPYFCTPHCGGGMTATVTVTAATGIETAKAPEAKITTMPNPFSQSTSVSVKVNAPSTLKLSVYDLSGRIIREENKIASTGENSYALDMTAYPAGMYLLMVNIKGSPAQTKLLIKE